MHNESSTELVTIELGPKLDTTSKIIDFLKPVFETLAHVEFHALCLTGDGHLLRHIRFVATSSQELDFGRISVDILSTKGTKAFVFAHNRLQGSPAPKTWEKHFRSGLTMALRRANIQLRDHLVFGREKVWSFKEKQMQELRHRFRH